MPGIGVPRRGAGEFESGGRDAPGSGRVPVGSDGSPDRLSGWSDGIGEGPDGPGWPASFFIPSAGRVMIELPAWRRRSAIFSKASRAMSRSLCRAIDSASASAASLFLTPRWRSRC